MFNVLFKHIPTTTLLMEIMRCVFEHTQLTLACGYFDDSLFSVFGIYHSIVVGITRGEATLGLQKTGAAI